MSTSQRDAGSAAEGVTAHTAQGTADIAAAQGFRLDAGHLRDLSRRRNGPALRRLAAHLGLVALGMAAVWHWRDTLWVAPLIWLTGYPLAFLFSVLHETAHQTAFRTRALNLAAGHLAGLLILLPYGYYQAFHWDHHRHTQQPGLDPELTLALPDKPASVIWLMLGLGAWFGRMVPNLLRHAAGRVRAPWVTGERGAAVVLEARLYLGVYLLVVAASLAWQTWAAIVLWLLPLAAGQMLLRPYLLAEHTGCDESADMLRNTRSIDTHPVVRFVAWNMPYHAEHHRYPAVPFHALPRLHALARPHLAHSTDGYRVAVRQVWRVLVGRGQAG